MCTCAAARGHFDLLRWARTEADPPCPWNAEASRFAAEREHWDVLRWMRVEADPPCPWSGQTEAIARKHFGEDEVASWPGARSRLRLVIDAIVTPLPRNWDEFYDGRRRFELFYTRVYRRLRARITLWSFGFVFFLVLAEASLIFAHYLAAGGGHAEDVARIRTVSTAAPAVLCMCLLWQKGDILASDDYDSDPKVRTFLAFAWFVAGDVWLSLFASWQDGAQQPFTALASCFALGFLAETWCTRHGGMRFDLGVVVVGVAVYLARNFVLPLAPPFDVDPFAVSVVVLPVACLAAAVSGAAAVALGPAGGFGALLPLFGALLFATHFACPFVLRADGYIPDASEVRDFAVLSELCKFFSYVAFTFAALPELLY